MHIHPGPVFSSATKLYKKDGNILLTLKAYNGRVVLQWLASVMSTVAVRYTDFDPCAPLIAAALCFGLPLSINCLSNMVSIMCSGLTNP